MIRDLLQLEPTSQRRKLGLGLIHQCFSIHHGMYVRFSDELVVTHARAIFMLMLPKNDRYATSEKYADDVTWFCSPG